MTFGQKLRELRISKGWNQEELGKIFHVSKAAISLYETDQRTPDQATLREIAKTFGVTSDYLLGLNNTPKWATEKDVMDLKNYLSGDQSFYYGGDKLTEEENEQLKVALAAIFWKRHNHKK